jgi:ferredoxin/flavodoxin---NADP+ reductase
MVVVNLLGSGVRPLRVAIIGAGPAGFYAAAALFSQKTVQVTIDLFERLPAPHGLVRYGVAPDHQKIKTVARIFDRTAATPSFRFFGNVNFGQELTREDLHQFYDAVVYAVGSQADRRLGIPGEDLVNSLSATEFVAWYNGHPDYTDLKVDLSGESAVVVGVGNVALDVARILARTTEELAPTDIALHAEDHLAASGVREIFVLSRRGPAQAKFSPVEIKEFGDLAAADIIIDPAELELDPLSAATLETDAEARRNMEMLRELAERPRLGRERRVHFRFLVSPVEILGDEGRVMAVRVEKNVLRADDTGYLNAYGTGQFELISAQLVLRAVGYRGVPLPGVPFDDRRGVIPNVDGRVTDPATGRAIPGEYVVGWAKRGAVGVIGTNRPDAIDTVQALLADVPTLPAACEPDLAAVERLLTARGVQFISSDGWRLIDEVELARGQELGKPRLKFTRVDEMVALAQDRPADMP